MKKVMIADDKKNLAKLIKDYTEMVFSNLDVELKIEVFTEEKLKKAIEEKGEFDLLITDIDLEEKFSRMDLLKKISADKKIAISGDTEKNAIPALQAGADNFLGKPFDLAKFREILEK